jgi:hypothetical protein
MAPTSRSYASGAVSSAQIHAVKTAAFRDVAARFGVRGLDALKRLGTAAFSEHKLPEYAGTATKRFAGMFGPKSVYDAALPVMHKGYGPGVISSVREALKNQSATGPTAAGAAARGAWNTARTVGHAVGEFGREMTLGSPVTAFNALKAKQTELGGWKPALKEHVQEFFAPKGGGAMGLALSAGLPAYQLYDAATHPDSDTRGSRLGGVAGSIAAMPFTSRLGYAGTLAQMGAARAGSAIGGVFDRTPPARQLPQGHQALQPPYSYARAPGYEPGGPQGVPG